MSDQTQPTWFVQISGKVQGPLTLADLRQLVRRGSIVSNTSVSRDRQCWIPAGALPALKEELRSGPPVPPPPLTPSYPSDAVGTRSLRPVWITAGIVCGVMLLGSFVICLGLIASLASFAPPSAAVVPAAKATSDADPDANATAACRIAVMCELGQPESLSRPAAAIPISTHLVQLATINVDLDAVRFVLNVSPLTRAFVRSAQRQDAPALLLAAMGRGAFGDSFGTLKGQMGRQKA